jgi:hypothetical protein
MTQADAIRRKYCRVRRGWKRWDALLCVDNQTFYAASDVSRRAAQWYTRQVATALAKIVETECGKEPK